MTYIDMESGNRRIRIKGDEPAAELTDIAERLWSLTDVPTPPTPPAIEGGALGFHTENAAADVPIGYGLDEQPTHPLPHPHA